MEPMTFQYVPEESDFLNYLYYVTTKSKRVQRKRTLNKLVVLFIYFITGLFLYNKQGPVTSGLFFLLCLPMYFFYSYFERRQYLKHFTRYISANYKDEIGVSTSIFLDDEGVNIGIGESNHKLLWTETESISETGSMILIQEKNQNSIVIPKEKTQNVEMLISQLKSLASAHNIKYEEELNWKWK
jgi:Ca2+/Na+ antiporter